VGPVTVSMVELVSGRQVPIRRMVANRSDRNEPVSYYTLIGTVVSSTSWREKVTQLRYGLSKRIPDGLLMRVSSIGNAEQEFPEQDAFLRELIQALPPQARVRVVGTESYA
jgi:EpsI family protein